MRNNRGGGSYIKTSALEAWEANELEPQLLHLHSWDFVRKIPRGKKVGNLQDFESKGDRKKRQQTDQEGMK